MSCISQQPGTSKAGSGTVSWL